jgi:mRNA interferase HigB
MAVKFCSPMSSNWRYKSPERDANEIRADRIAPAAAANRWSLHLITAEEFACALSGAAPRTSKKMLAPTAGTCHSDLDGHMRIISRRRLRVFWQSRGCADAEQPLKAWFREASRAEWTEPADIKEMYRSASFVGGNRVVFNIAGNKYRLVVDINYSYQTIYIRFVGTHSQYDRINAREI